MSQFEMVLILLKTFPSQKKYIYWSTYLQFVQQLIELALSYMADV